MRNYTKIILLLTIPLLAILLYGMSDAPWPSQRLALTKVDMMGVKDLWQNTTHEKKDTLPSMHKDNIKPVPIDSSHHRILFFGDSMLEGLCRRIRQLAITNGDTVTAVCWYSSTSEIWAKSDTLQYFLRQVQPTYIMICLCANEQFVRDLPERGKYIDCILQKINKYSQSVKAKHPMPIIWIAPPSWKQDTGINDLIKKKVGIRRYFDSTRLTFRRGSDHMHPTFSSAAEWMDSVAVWMQSQQTEHPKRMFQQKPANSANTIQQKPANSADTIQQKTANPANTIQQKPANPANGKNKAQQNAIGKFRLILLQPYELTKK